MASASGNAGLAGGIPRLTTEMRLESQADATTRETPKGARADGLSGGRPAVPLIVPEALRDALTVLLGIAPFAVTIGIALRRLDISHPLGVIASGLMYSGSAQLAAINLLDGGA